MSFNGDSPVLSAPDFSLPFILEVDASAVGAGAVLLQEDEQGINHPVSYFSRKFNSNLNTPPLKRRLLHCCSVYNILRFTLGQVSSLLRLWSIMVFTDQNPLVFLSGMYNHKQRLMRWSLIIQDYHLEICHKKGSGNVLADALSVLCSRGR